MTERFDIFLSHAYRDARVIAGVKRLIEDEGLSVYVDWIEDVQLDRESVTPGTASILRQRMQHCGHLVFASSEASPKSRWMPWELGYFDGLRQGHISIFPLVQQPGDQFKGQEYLGLYPAFELITIDGINRLATLQGGSRVTLRAASRV